MERRELTLPALKRCKAVTAPVPAEPDKAQVEYQPSIRSFASAKSDWGKCQIAASAVTVSDS
jgi:hypothetical protein